MVHLLKEYLYRNLYLIWISDWIFCCSVCLSTSLRPGCSGNNNKKHSLRLNQFKHQSQRKCFLFYSAIFGRWTITCDNDYNQEVDCIEHVLNIITILSTYKANNGHRICVPDDWLWTFAILLCYLRTLLSHFERWWVGIHWHSLSSGSNRTIKHVLVEQRTNYLAKQQKLILWDYQNNNSVMFIVDS